MNDAPKNEGEGNRTAAKEYNKKTQHFVENEDVESKAENAREDLEQDGQAGLDDAEKLGKSKAREFDPQVKQDR